MNKTEMKKQLAIAEDQAHISELKMNFKFNEGKEYASFIYKTRAAALRMLAAHLRGELKKQERKTFKRVNK
jgi:uncharacterized membrane-anchored protein